MTSNPFKAVVVILLLGAGTAALIVLHLENRRLRDAVAARRAEARQNAALQRENNAMQAIVTTAAGPGDRVGSQLAEARAEVATLERQADEVAAQKAYQENRDRADLVNNRDPRTGLTRIEYFQPAGRGTPTAAVQTAIWAAAKGDEATLIDATVLLPSARAKAEELLAGIPEGARAQWTPERLAALWMSGVINDVSALQITDESYPDPQHATVAFRIANRDEPEHVNLRSTKTGWKIVLSDSAISQLARRLNAVAAAPK